jgi:hypothetical protein
VSSSGGVITVRRSKTDQEGEGRKIAIPRGREESLNPYMMAQGITYENQVEREGIVMLTPASPGFRAEAERFFAADALSVIEPLLPFCIIIKNDTTKYLSVATVLYTFPSVTVPGQGPIRQRIAATTMTKDRNRMLEPGYSRFVSPIGAIQATIDASGKRLLWPIFSELLVKHMGDWVAFYGKQTISIAVDSIVFEDGSLVGPDKGGLLSDLNARAKAEEDLRNEISGLHGSQLEAYLDSKSDLEPDREDEYGKWKQGLSLQLRSGIKQFGEEVGVSEFNSKRESRVKSYKRRDQ